MFFQGDLNMDGTVESPFTTVAENSPVYPYGTTEMFPQMEDSAHNVLANTAHYYMECSNKVNENSCFVGHADGILTARNPYQSISSQGYMHPHHW
jgi:hypothetical protein